VPTLLSDYPIGWSLFLFSLKSLKKDYKTPCKSL